MHVETDNGKNVLVLHRWAANQHLVCFMNFSKKQQFILPPSNVQDWKKLFDSAAQEWEGPQSSPDAISGGVPGMSMLALQPESVVVYADAVSIS